MSFVFPRSEATQDPFTPRRQGLLRGASLRNVAMAVVALAAVTAAMFVFRGRLEKAHIALIYLLVVLGGSASGGRFIGLFTGGLAFLCFNLFFLPPYYTLTVEDPLDWLVLVTFLVTSIVAAELLDRQARQAALAEARAHELDRLSTLGAETLNAARAEQALAAIAKVIRDATGVARCELFAWDGKDHVPQPIAVSTRDADSAPASLSSNLLAYVVEERRSAVEWEDGTLRVLNATDDGALAAGRSRALAIPLTARGQTVGVLQLSDAVPFSLSADRRRVLDALAYYAALGIERSRLEGSEETAEALRRADRLKDALLAAVSHDLRTPLTTIKGIAHEIALRGDNDAVIIEEEADRLASLVEGLLELSQLDAGAPVTRTEVNTVDDLVGAALQRARAVVSSHALQVDLGHDALLVGTFDFSQSVRVLVNLLENAAKYSPGGSPIHVTARRVDDDLLITVSDRGRGIPDGEQERIFQPFYRVPGAQADVRGAGLGLSIARGLARAQSGDLTVALNPGGGSVFTLRLPAAELPTG